MSPGPLLTTAAAVGYLVSTNSSCNTCAEVLTYIVRGLYVAYGSRAILEAIDANRTYTNFKRLDKTVKLYHLTPNAKQLDEFAQWYLCT